MTWIRIAALWALAVAAAAAAELSVRYERWTWTEEDRDGTRLLREEGPLLGLGIAAERPGAGAWSAAGRLDAFLGEVDYDGSTQAGEPVETTTEYYGIIAEADARRVYALGEALELRPRAGFGWRSWLRRIDNSGRFSNGYDESWNSAYGLLGAELRHRVGDAAVFAGATCRAPVFNRVRYHLTTAGGDDNVTVEPGREPGWRVEAGIERGAWTLCAFFERMDFPRSDAEVIPPFEVFQPESRGEVVGLRLGTDW